MRIPDAARAAAGAARALGGTAAAALAAIALGRPEGVGGFLLFAAALAALRRS